MEPELQCLPLSIVYCDCYAEILLSIVFAMQLMQFEQFLEGIAVHCVCCAAIFIGNHFLGKSDLWAL